MVEKMLDGNVVDDPFDLAGILQQIEQTLVGFDTMILDIELAQARGRPVETMAGDLLFEEPLLDDPIELATQLHWIFAQQA
jgi:hypothetical protein